jgi:hypothetical protein
MNYQSIITQKTLNTNHLKPPLPNVIIKPITNKSNNPENPEIPHRYTISPLSERSNEKKNIEIGSLAPQTIIIKKSPHDKTSFIPKLTPITQLYSMQKDLTPKSSNNLKIKRK